VHKILSITAVFLIVLIGLMQTSPLVFADFTFGTGADQFTITTVAVGNAGNSADSNGNGSVSHSYEVMKYEVTRGMVFKFNNLNDPSSGSRDITLDLGYDPNTETNVFNPHRFNTYGAIASGYKDTLSATGIGGLEAAQFVNWLNVDAGYSAAYNLDTNSDSTDLSTWSIAAWDSGDTGYLASQPFRNSEARSFS
jgi:sulfatase modifying factor 1